MNIFTPIIVEKINELVTLLNEDLKTNEKYSIVGVSMVEELDITVVQVKNLKDEFMYNALDYQGETPNGFSACWRSLSSLAHDFNITI